jgi:hypothetical protein
VSIPMILFYSSPHPPLCRRLDVLCAAGLNDGKKEETIHRCGANWWPSSEISERGKENHIKIPSIE